MLCYTSSACSVKVYLPIEDIWLFKHSFKMYCLCTWLGYVPISVHLHCLCKLFMYILYVYTSGYFSSGYSTHACIQHILINWSLFYLLPSQIYAYNNCYNTSTTTRTCIYTHVHIYTCMVLENISTIYACAYMLACLCVCMCVCVHLRIIMV